MKLDSHDSNVFFDILEKIRVNFKFLMFFSIIFTTPVLLFISAATPRWESYALIQVAKVGGKDLKDEFNLIVESPLTTAARVTHPSFIKRIIEKSNLTVSEKNIAFEDMVKTIEATQRRGTILVDITFQTSLKSHATSLMNALIVELRSEHAKISSPSINIIKSNLNNLLKSKALKTEALLELRRNSVAGDQKINNAIKALAGEQLKYEIDQLDQKISDQETLLTPRFTQETGLIGDIFLSNSPVYPNKLSTIVLTFIFSFFFGFVSLSFLKKS